MGTSGAYAGIHRIDMPYLLTWKLADGHGVILDSSYRLAANVQISSSSGLMDMHEFHLTEDWTHALATSYVMTPADLSSDGNTASLGWILDSGFQEIDIRSHHVLFDWRSSNHILELATKGIDKHYDTGDTIHSAWDNFHINSADKLPNGDYVISSRQLSTIYRISGQNGSVLWELGGPNFSFNLTNFNLGYQHDVQVLEQESSRYTTIQLFNNGGDGQNKAIDGYSFGAIIQLDHLLETATLTQTFGEDEGIFSQSQGDVQALPDGHTLVGWGSSSYVAEHDANGTLLFKAVIANFVSPNYRVHKADWKGMPQQPPAIWAYAKNESSPLVVYTSWNGATEVASWRIHIGKDETHKKSFRIAGSSSRTGFETMIRSAEQLHDVLVFAEVVDQNGISLGNSTIKSVYMPSAELEPSCGVLACPVHNRSQIHRSQHFARPGAADLTHSSNLAENKNSKHAGNTASIREQVTSSDVGSESHMWQTLINCYAFLLTGIVSVTISRKRFRDRQ
jgi:hypothetical protein